MIAWLLIIIPLWLQPIHMWGMGEMVVDHHGMIDLNNLEFHLAHWNFWTDMLLLSIDHLEWVAIVAGTERFIRYLKERNKND